MHPSHAPLAGSITIEHAGRSPLPPSLRALLLLGSLWLTVASARSQQQELLALAVASGRMSQIAALHDPQRPLRFLSH